MSQSSRRFFIVSKKTFLIKLVSVLGFGGMIGFCILGCDKQGKVTRDVVDENDYEIEMTTVYAPPLEIVGPDEQVDELERRDTAPSTDVLESKQPMPEEEVEQNISVKYGVPPLPEQDVTAMYGAPAPKL